MTIGSQVKSCFSSIKSAEATISLLANKAQDKQSKQVYEETNTIITEIKDEMEKQVIRLTQEEPQYKG